MKKKILVLGLVIVMTLFSATAFAEGGIIVRIDSANAEFNDDIGRPFIDENNRTLVPFKAVLEAFGAEVDWNNENRTAIAKKGDITVEVPIGELYLLKNGEKIETDTVAVIKDGRTYLPIRKVIEAFGSEVQWDAKANTVVITTTPIESRKALMDAYAKSYEWENYDMNMKMNMSMPLPEEAGGLGNMNMVMDMQATYFMKPMKMKASANMALDLGTEKLDQPIMEMYFDVKDDKFNMYMGMYNENGELTWNRTTLKDDAFVELLKMDAKKNLELNEKMIKDVRFLGKYTDASGKTLLKFENTTSFEAYNEIMGNYINMLSVTGAQENLDALEMIKNLDDLTFVIYVDEATGEAVKYEMDLSSLMTSMFGSMADNDMLPAELLEMFKSLKVEVVMEVLNINEAKDFEIPKEALNAPEVEELLESAIKVEDTVTNVEVEDTEVNE